jgi:hypothetical protein
MEFEAVQIRAIIPVAACLLFAIIPATLQELAAQQTVPPAAIPTTARTVPGGAPDANRPLITISGLCDHSSTSPANDACKTVVTRGQFDALVNAIEPGMPKHARLEFATQYADALVLADRAQQLGLDQGQEFEERMKLARIEILTGEMKRKIAQDSANIPEKDIEDFYRNNTERFERAEVERIFIPRDREASAAQAGASSGAGDKSQAAGDPSKNEADKIHARALAGDPFPKLQADAYGAVGVKSQPPSTTFSIRRVSLPPAQASVMDLKAGEVSSVFPDPNGYFIYKMKSKEVPPIEEERGEIKEVLRSQRAQSELHKIMGPNAPVLDESYFAR